MTLQEVPERNIINYRTLFAVQEKVYNDLTDSFLITLQEDVEPDAPNQSLIKMIMPPGEASDFEVGQERMITIQIDDQI